MEPDISKQPTYLDCDAVVLALGQSSELDLLRWMGIAENKGLAAVEKGRFQTDKPQGVRGGRNSLRWFIDRWQHGIGNAGSARSPCLAG